MSEYSRRILAGSGWPDGAALLPAEPSGPSRSGPKPMGPFKSKKSNLARAHAKAAAPRDPWTTIAPIVEREAVLVAAKLAHGTGSAMTGARAVFTDGSTLDDGRSGAAAVFDIYGSLFDASVHIGRANSLVAELAAVLLASMALKRARLEGLIIYSDHKGLVEAVSRNGRSRSHPKVVEAIQRLLGETDSRLRHVPGHSGFPLNVRADRLAGQAAKGAK